MYDYITGRDLEKSSFDVLEVDYHFGILIKEPRIKPAYIIQDNRFPAEIRTGHLLVPLGSQS
jgi:hypothetical protein